MKAKWMMLTIMILFFLASLIGCGPKSRLAPAKGGMPSSPQTSTTSPPMVTGLTGTTPGPETVISPTQDTSANMEMNETPGMTPTFGDTARQSVELARQNLAGRLGMPVEDIQVAAVIGQEFTPNAFYCRVSKDRIAKDDTPASISGWSILLGAAGRRYEYHASDQVVVFCQSMP